MTSRVNWKRFLMISCALVLVGTEVFAVAVGAGWAIAGLFELGERISYALMALFSGIGLWAMVKLWQQANRVEPVWDDEAGERAERLDRRPDGVST